MFNSKTSFIIKKRYLYLFFKFVFLILIFLGSTQDVSAVSCYENKRKRKCSISGGVGCSASNKNAECGYCTNYPDCSWVSVGRCSNATCRCPKSNPCPCSPRACPTPIPPTKFMQTPNYINGSSISCSNPCSPATASCPPSYKNTPPTCSIIPTNIPTTRTAAPKSFTLNVTDKDYGDTVKVKSVRVVDIHGNLKSCVNVTTQNGGLIDNLVVKTGSNSSSDIRQSTILQVDARSAYGVYDSVGGGLSKCEGIIQIEIADTDSDGSGPDVSDYVTCSLNVSVTNDNPTISDIRIEDNDANPTLRRTGNLANQYKGAAGPLPIGSLFDARRVASCSSAVDMNYNAGECRNWIPEKTRTNPYSLSFKVTDNEGYKDIKDIGFWIQRADGAASLKVPLSSGNLRQSIQGLIGQRKDYKIPAGTNNNYFTAAPCIGEICSKNILTENLLSYMYIGAKVERISISQRRASDYTEWLKVGFPNCLFTTSGCNATNIPTNSKSTISEDRSKFYNYDWMIAADNTHMLCLSSTSNTSKVLPVSGACHSSCAACVVLEELEPVAGDPNSVQVKFLISMNDRFIDGGNGQGMEEGRYEVFVGSRDTVGGLAYGTNFWKTIGGSANAFSLKFDAQPPTVFEFGINQVTEEIEVLGRINDTAPSAQQSTGVSGIGTRYIIQEVYENPTDLLGTRSFLSKTPGSTTNLWNGANDFVDSVTPKANGDYIFSFKGYSVIGSAGISAGLCTYDNAGNMCCAQTVNVDNTDARTKECANYADAGLFKSYAAWLQASIGSVYSNADAGENAFANMIVPDTSKGTEGIYAPYNYQSGSAASGLLVSSGSGAGITGGRIFNTTEFNALGFSNNTTTKGNYRTTDETEDFNIYNIASAEERDWYGILYSSIKLNCELSNNCYSNEEATEQKLPYVQMENSSKQGYVTISKDENMITPLICKNINIIFITNGAKVSLTEVHNANKNSACMFVVDKDASLTIKDQDLKNGTLGAIPGIDKFEAAIVVANGGKFETLLASTLKPYPLDRLKFEGFLYSDAEPIFGRRLKNKDNEFYSAEWFVYNANLLDQFRTMLGMNKVVDLVCGTSDNILCTSN